MKLKVLIAAGGSGGHLFPAQRLFESLKGDCEVAFAGHKLSQTPFFAKEKIPFEEIAASPVKRGFIQASWRGFWQSMRTLRLFQPDIVVGFGSYHTFPLLAAAAVLQKKMLLFEANCVMGKVNRLFLPWAKKIALQFPLESKKGVLVRWMATEPKSIAVGEARRYFGLSPDRLTFLVFGGSQGAQFLNEAMPLACDLLHERGLDFQVIHFTGNSPALYRVPACVKPFEKEMAYAYAAADIAICRSGAGTAAELIRFEKPALLIPFPLAAEDHQMKNGEFLVKLGGARLMLQGRASIPHLSQEIERLVQERDKMRFALARAKEQKQSRVDFGVLVRSIGEGK